MKNAEILKKMNVGDIVTNKQLLATFKKLNHIYDYSFWGYLESGRIYYKVTEPNGRMSWDYIFAELIANKTARKIIDNSVYVDSSNIAHAYTKNEFSYGGCTFRTKYLSGCFQPYLQLVKKDGEKTDPTKTQEKKICLYGNIVNWNS